MHGMINILNNMFTIYHSSGITYVSITIGILTICLVHLTKINKQIYRTMYL